MTTSRPRALARPLSAENRPSELAVLPDPRAPRAALPAVVGSIQAERRRSAVEDSMIRPRPSRAGRGLVHGRAAGLCLLWCCTSLSACPGSSVHRGPPDPPDGGQPAAGDGQPAADAGQQAQCDGSCSDVGAVACSTGTTRCGAVCVSLYSDSNHCGRCDNVCEETECFEGSCGITLTCKKSGESCSGGNECCQGLICGYYGSYLACKLPDA